VLRLQCAMHGGGLRWDSGRLTVVIDVRRRRWRCERVGLGAAVESANVTGAKRVGRARRRE